MGSWLGVKGAEETEGGGGLGGVALSEGGEVEGAIFAEERAQERGADQGEVAGAAGVAAEFLVFAPGDVAAIVVAAFDFPMPATAGEPLAESERGALGGGNEEAGLCADGVGFLVRDGARHRDHRGGVGEAELLGRNGGESQLAVFDATVAAVVGEKRGGWPVSACVAAAWTAAVLPLSWMRYSPPAVTMVRAVS